MRILRFIAIVSGLAAFACQGDAGLRPEGDGNAPNNNTVQPADVNAELVAANTAFGFKLFNELATEYDGQNLFVSPPSVAIALAMTYNGAAGATADAMAHTLALDGMDVDSVNASYAELLALLSDPDSVVQLSIANSLWAREGLDFKQDFLQRNRDYYRAEVSALDFSDPGSATRINNWVNDQTRGKINGIVSPPIDPQTILFLINAIYFKGAWTVEFDKASTEDSPFHLLDGSIKKHPRMYRSGDYRYFQNSQFQAVRLPYGSGRISMYVFLPSAESNLREFEHLLTAENWSNWMSEFQTLGGDIALPRFRLEFETSLNEALIALGMAPAFSFGGADFSAMFPVSAGANVYISNVKHKTFVEVNEEGTEAAAVTSVEMGVTSDGPPRNRFSMIVDRPFFFAIRDDRSGTVLFMGSIVEPL